MILEDYSALIIQNNQFSFLSAEGEFLHLPLQSLHSELKKNTKILVIHSAFTYRKLKSPKTIRTDQWLDLIELAAFIFPTRSFGFTIQSFANTLNISLPTIIEADLLLNLMDHLIEHLKEQYTQQNREIIAAQLAALYYAQWLWAPILLDILAISLPLPANHLQPADSLKIWRRLPKWQDMPPRPQPSQYPLERKETLTRLATLLGPHAENRVGQTDLTDITRFAFEPCLEQGHPNVVLAEAGTGTGKTLAYIAPASLWAERNQGSVWINTYTRHLQRQIEEEFKRLYPDPKLRQKHIIVRKGRENYLCLLNLEEHLNSSLHSTQYNRNKIAIILLCRWAEASNDGDLFGGDLPNWYHDLFNDKILYSLAERRGECIHAACPHYQTCFVEQSIHKAQYADIVIANHALLINQFTWSLENASPEWEQSLPTHLIFDEAHHLPDATDSAFTVALSALETSELRRWLLGNEGNKTRSKGLKKRIYDIIIGDKILEENLETILKAAYILPPLNWSSHLMPKENNDTEYPHNSMEHFFFLIQKQIQARTLSPSTEKNIPLPFEQNECDLFPILPELQILIPDIIQSLRNLFSHLQSFIKKIDEKLTNEKEKLDKNSHDRLDVTRASLIRRAINPLTLWINLLTLLNNPESPYIKSETHITFLKIEKKNNFILDIGLFHHWLDPTIPFMKMISQNIQGMLLTSATLKDEGSNDTEAAWTAAEQRIGTIHLPTPPIRAALTCPFDYKQQARVYIVNDLNILSIQQLAHAYLHLFKASKGGALGLFTAIHRLRAVHEKIVNPLEQANISLFAQHVDPLSNNSLVDLFKSDTHSCLLGTDAMRDGINIPGHALRLVVFEKVPWPRPDILHRERRKYFYKNAPHLYDDQIVRLRLRQAFGRLIRNQTDKGIFIILDRRTPSRILSAFPKETPIQRLSLELTLKEIENFYTKEAFI